MIMATCLELTLNNNDTVTNVTKNRKKKKKPRNKNKKAAITEENAYENELLLSMSRMAISRVISSTVIVTEKNPDAHVSALERRIISWYIYCDEKEEPKPTFHRRRRPKNRFRSPIQIGVIETTHFTSKEEVSALVCKCIDIDAIIAAVNWTTRESHFPVIFVFVLIVDTIFIFAFYQ
jgi:hypothetical protein